MKMSCLFIPFIIGSSALYAQQHEQMHYKQMADLERAKQKALLTLVSSGVLLGASKYLQGTQTFAKIGDFFNLTSGEFQAACTLAGLLSFWGWVAREELARPVRSIGWRIPVIAALGGVVSHPKINTALQSIPILENWVAANPVGDKKGIFAIYAIGAYAMIKPSLDRIENFISGRTSHLYDHFMAEDEHTQMAKEIEQS